MLTKRIKIKYRCGHSEKIYLSAINENALEDKIAWHKEHSLLCSDCYKQAIKEEKHKRADKVTFELKKDNQVPELYGSFRQIYWSETIRAQMISEAIKSDLKDEEKSGLIGYIFKMNSCKWFIDNRNRTSKQILSDIDNIESSKAVITESLIDAINEFNKPIRIDDPEEIRKEVLDDLKDEDV